MAMKKTLIDTCINIAAVARSNGLTMTQFHLWSFITARLARREPADTRTLFKLLGECPMQLSTRISKLIDDGFFTAQFVGKGYGDGRKLKATDKTKQLIMQLNQ